MPSATTEVELLRAIRELADPAAHDAGTEPMLPTLLGRLLDCEVVVHQAEASVPIMEGGPTADPVGATHLVIAGALHGEIGAAALLGRPPDRPFGEREILLCDLLRPHVASWLNHGGDAPDGAGRPALTQRQLEILALVRCGMSNKEVARALGITRTTVRKHLENAFVRLGVTTRTAAAAEAFRAHTDAETAHV
nr:LuxR family transcriptional regulator [Ornithinimicrobium sp. F0845]